jgi:uncharacterized membrane protein
MTPVLDPLWPWSVLLAILSPAGLAVAALAAGAGVLTYWLPVLLRWPAPGARRRRAARGLGVAGGMVLVWVALGAVAGTGSVRGRAVDLGAAALLLSPLALVGLTVWTYVGVAGASRRRIAAVVALRLAAFLLALLALLRPALGVADKSQAPGVLYLLGDHSASMTIADEADGRTRWEALVRHLREAGPALRRLRDEGQTEVDFWKFAGDAAPLDPDDTGAADGKRTDIGAALRKLFEGWDGRRRPRGLLILSDGADNGSARTPALAEAARWRGVPCPVTTFTYGKTTTSDRQSDVVLTAITPDPSPVPVKGELTVKASVDAYGFQNRRVRVKLLIDGKEASATDAVLTLTAGNEVRVKATAPAAPGEVRVTVRVEDPDRDGQPLDGEVSAANNEMSTYLTVTKEGLSVLLVDKPRAWEPQAICDALTRDPRVHLYPVWLRGEGPAAAGAADLFRFDRQQYDVILLGDVTADQLRAVSADAPAKLEQLVSKGAGLMMLGGYATFAEGGWPATPLKDLLPVEVAGPGAERGQVGAKVKMEPTDAGLRLFSYLLRLSDTAKDPREAWDQLLPLDGMTRLGRPKPAVASVLAVNGNGGEPLLVAGQYGAGRTLAFGGDTTWRWVRDEKTQEMHARFWRQAVVWLARQEDTAGSVWVKPDTRRLPARVDLGFSAGLNGKGGVPLPGGTFRAEVVAPDGTKTDVPVTRTADGFRGTFTRAEAPGEYRLVVRGEGRDTAAGGEVRGEASARFLVYDDDAELTNRAANHDLLRKLAAAGGGTCRRGEELRAFLEELLRQPQGRERPKLTLYPDWRTTGTSSFLPAFFAAFVAVLSAEWLLRRRWGMA